MKVIKTEVRIMDVLRKNKDRWLSTTQIWRKLGEKPSYTTVAIILKKFREQDTISFDRYQDLKKGNQFENIYRYKEDALDEIIM